MHRTNVVVRACRQVVHSYIKCMLDSVEVVVMSEGTLDDPLDDEGSLKEQLERLPVICLFQYVGDQWAGELFLLF
jgi:hypothetical protein